MSVIAELFEIAFVILTAIIVALGEAASSDKKRKGKGRIMPNDTILSSRLILLIFKPVCYEMVCPSPLKKFGVSVAIVCRAFVFTKNVLNIATFVIELRK
jgi:hypothetical protein